MLWQGTCDIHMMLFYYIHGKYVMQWWAPFGIELVWMHSRVSWQSKPDIETWIRFRYFYAEENCMQKSFCAINSNTIRLPRLHIYVYTKFTFVNIATLQCITSDFQYQIHVDIMLKWHFIPRKYYNISATADTFLYMASSAPHKCG